MNIQYNTNMYLRQHVYTTRVINICIVTDDFLSHTFFDFITLQRFIDPVFDDFPVYSTSVVLPPGIDLILNLSKI